MIARMHDTNELDHMRQYNYTVTADVVNFLAELFHQCPFAECLQNSHFFSPLESIHVEDKSVGQHPLVSWVLKEAFNERPPRLKYQSNWDIDVQERR